MAKPVSAQRVTVCEYSDGIRWSLAAEVVDLLSARASLKAGAEVWFEGLAARAGYDGAAPTFGVSVQFESFQVDWAYSASRDLGGSHRVSLEYRF